ncbi:MAG: aminotransferase class I/II-fold pyridoxal phosphate-dependent enzyme [Clostridia bacterium]|nr:aminotransferase class I/II-fold pyridoxal phosphate-dependent enzyme [Clostridia bacterium]
MSSPFDFERLVPREGLSTLKEALCGEPDVLPLAGAEADFATAPSVVRAVTRFAEAGLYAYTLPDDRYRQAVSAWLRDVRGLEVEPAWIVPTHGTIFSLATAIRLLTKEGEGVVVQPPVYGRFAQAARRLGRRVVANPLRRVDGRWAIDLDDLERRLAEPGTRLLVLCQPHNPVGRVFSEEELRDVARLCLQYDAYVFSDEIFGDFALFGRRAPSFLAIAEAHPRAIVATSLGKSFSLTGINHANVLVADPDLRRSFSAQRDRDHYGSLDPFARQAVLGAYSPEGRAWFEAFRRHVEGNVEALAAGLAGLEAVGFTPPEGTFVAWLDLGRLGLPEPELMSFLRREARLCLDPGGDYGEGGEGFVRLNLATARSRIEEAVRRLAAALSARFAEREEAPPAADPASRKEGLR